MSEPQPQADLAARVAPRALALTGGTDARLATLRGDASNRRYHRVAVVGGEPSSLIVMELGPNPLASEEASKGERPGELPFVNVLRYLERGGIAVPRLYADDSANGLLFLEDLGDTTFESLVQDADRDSRSRLYRLAMADLLRLQRYAARPDPSCIAFGRAFDVDLLLWELHHFREWLLEADRAARLTPSETDLVSGAFSDIATRLAAAPRLFVHRDYQSRNLMVQPGPRLRLLDFQDALLGTQAYDLVALLRDSYVELAPDLVQELVQEFARQAGLAEGPFAALFDLQTVQRKLKDAGRFVFIDRVKGNPSFRPWIPASLRYVRAALGRLPELAPLQRVLGRYVPELS